MKGVSTLWIIKCRPYSSMSVFAGLIPEHSLTGSTLEINIFGETSNSRLLLHLLKNDRRALRLHPTSKNWKRYSSAVNNASRRFFLPNNLSYGTIDGKCRELVIDHRTDMKKNFYYRFAEEIHKLFTTDSKKRRYKWVTDTYMYGHTLWFRCGFFMGTPATAPHHRCDSVSVCDVLDLTRVDTQRMHSNLSWESFSVSTR